MKSKELLKLIEQACDDKIITHHDLMELGLDIQRKEIAMQKNRINRISEQISNYIEKRDKPFSISPITYIEQPHLN